MNLTNLCYLLFQLEEIKTKERNIGQLRKDLLALRSPKKLKQNEAKVPATTKPKTNPNETSQKPKKPTTKAAGETKAKTEPDTDTDISEQNPIRQAQVTPEVSLYFVSLAVFLCYSCLEWGQHLNLPESRVKS